MEPPKKRWTAVGAGILAAAVCLAVVAWISARDIAQRREEILRETQVVARLFATRIQGGLQRYVTSLEQMANFYSSSRKVSEKEFRSFAATTLRKSPACVTVAFVDPAFLVRSIYPPGEQSVLIGLDMRAHPIGYETIVKARRMRGALLSPPLQLIRGPGGFELAVPAFSAGRFLGTLLAACRSEDYFASMLLPEMSERHDERVIDTGATIFTSECLHPSDHALPAVPQP